MVGNRILGEAMIAKLIPYVTQLRRLLRAPYVLWQRAVASSVTGTTAITPVVEVDIPALGPNDSLRITTKWRLTNNGNAKIFRAVYGGQLLGGGNLAGCWTATHQLFINNQGSTNAQLGSIYSPNPFGSSAVDFYVGTVESSQPRKLALSMELGVAGDAAELCSCLVELIPG